MTFDEALDQIRELLRQRGRVTYRSLQLRYQLDEEMLAGIVGELIRAERVAVDEDGKVLIWTGPALGVGSVSQASRPSFDNAQSPSQAQPLATRPAGGERRQLTVEFIDLVGSTTLSHLLDPEDYHTRVVAYQTACHQVIARYEGHIAQYLGDGVLVYFGYPAAHEEDAVRAVRSGLDIVAAIRQLAFLPPLQVRIGIHTGPVVIGEIGAGARTEKLALGETPNLAARLQEVAEPETVVISAVTHRLIHGWFETQQLEPQILKGGTTPLPAYRIIGESTAQSRFEAALRTGLTPLVGRESELSFLQQWWEQTKAGEGQVVLLRGEPGIGKSRLVQELKERLAHEGATRIEFRCSPYHQHSALYPILDHLQRLLQFVPEDSPAIKLEKLQQTLSHYRFPQADTAPLLAALLSLPHPEGAPSLTMSPQNQKEQTQAALVAWLLEEAAQQPVYNAWEDVHWADPSTLEVLNLVVSHAPTVRMYVLLTFRPEFIPPWGNRRHLRQLTLNRLARHQVEMMIERVTGGKALPSEMVQHIVAKTDGVPLFVEELTKMVMESSLVTEINGRYELPGPLPPLAIPDTLQDSLMARLDRLATVREVAQLGATLGREFPYELLQAVSPLGEVSLQHALTTLVEAEVLYQRGRSPHARYLFKHVLIQDAAYQSLLKSTRRQYHSQIAYVLEERFSETVETQPELVAHHYTEAGLISRAISYWQRAGERATQRLANVEAVAHLTKGLELLQTLPETPERTQQELTLQIALGVPLMATAGYAAPGVESAYARARQLCQQLGESPQLFPALRGLWVYYLLRAELSTTSALGKQLLTLAQRVHEPALLVEAHYTCGATLFFRGAPARARTHLEQCRTLYHPQRHGSHAFLYGQDPGVFAHIVAALALWVLGYGDQALKRIHAAVTLAQELSHQFSIAGAMLFVAWLHHFRREEPETHEWAQAVMTLSREQGFPFWLAWGMVLQGLTLAELGQAEESIAQMRQGLLGLQATGAELVRPYILAKLAEAYGERGQPEEALPLIAEALAVASYTEEHWSEAELYRLKGQLTLQRVHGSASPWHGPHLQHVPSHLQAEAEGCFRQALEIARRQSAKSLELRAAMSLSRVWQRQGRKADARHLLAESYGWFTEGFDTKDLQEAKALLDELR